MTNVGIFLYHFKFQNFLINIFWILCRSRIKLALLLIPGQENNLNSLTLMLLIKFVVLTLPHIIQHQVKPDL